jgi:hypothetical protein
MALFAGLRDAEVYRVGWECYSQSEGILSVPAAIRKNKVGNVVPVVNTLKKGIDELNGFTYSSASSLGGIGSTPATGTIIPCSPSIVRAELRKVTHGKWTGLQPARRLLVTVAESAGYTSEQISMVTGHARTSMVSRYSHGAEQLELKRRILEDVERRLVV